MAEKIVIIAGGSGLLGKSFAHAIVHAGGTAIVADVDASTGQAFVEQVQKDEKNNGHITFAPLDITNKKSITDIISFAVSQYGKIDALVNCAYPRNKHYGKKFEDITYEDFCENVNMHLGGYFLTSQQFVSFFKKQGYGNIINIASIYGVIPPRFEIYEGTPMTMPIEYAAIKSAIIHCTTYIAKYCKGFNIRANCISPGGIFDKQPESFVKKYNAYCLSKGMLDTYDITGTLLYLLSDASQHVNGQNIVVDDGFSL